VVGKKGVLLRLSILTMLHSLEGLRLLLLLLCLLLRLLQGTLQLEASHVLELHKKSLILLDNSLSLLVQFIGF
jgi:hypothetical protein